MGAVLRALGCGAGESERVDVNAGGAGFHGRGGRGGGEESGSAGDDGRELHVDDFWLVF